VALFVFVILTYRSVVWKILFLESSHKGPDSSQHLSYVSSLFTRMLEPRSQKEIHGIWCSHSSG
jgi:hypothetical protein